MVLFISMFFVCIWCWFPNLKLHIVIFSVISLLMEDENSDCEKKPHEVFYSRKKCTSSPSNGTVKFVLTSLDPCFDSFIDVFMVCCFVIASSFVSFLDLFLHVVLLLFISLFHCCFGSLVPNGSFFLCASTGLLWFNGYSCRKRLLLLLFENGIGRFCFFSQR